MAEQLYGYTSRYGGDGLSNSNSYSRLSIGSYGAYPYTAESSLLSSSRCFGLVPVSGIESSKVPSIDRSLEFLRFPGNGNIGILGVSGDLAASGTPGGIGGLVGPSLSQASWPGVGPLQLAATEPAFSGFKRSADVPCFSSIEGKQVCSPSVVVIGGGFAGIAAARALHDASFQVVLLESRDRLGGRVYTDYSFGFPVDMGASWLHGVCKENPLAPLIGRLGLPLYRTSEDNSVLYDHDLQSYALFDIDGHQVPQELVIKVGQAFESILKETEKVRQEHSEDMSVLQAFSIVLERRPDLRQEGIAHKVLQWYICRMEGWFSTDVDTISLKCWDQEELLSGGHGLMVRGYCSVINTLAKGLDIRLSHRVTKITRCLNGVEVAVENGITFVAAAAVVAVPLGVLKANSIRFEPRLPEWKEEAISDLGVGTENKIALHFDKVFWPNVEFLGVVASTSYGCSYFLNLHKATGHPVLVYMPAGRLAHDIEKMSDEAAANFAFLQLKGILPNATEPIQYLVSRWGSDANSLGSYSYDAVGKPHDLYEKLRIPVDNLFFAGEATSTQYPGTVHGAFSTGLMAAEECRMRVLERYGELDLLHSSMGELTSASVPLLISRL